MNIKEKVINFVAEQTGVDAEKITLDTTINNDLGIDGVEGSNFLLDFSKAFNVDLQPINKIYFGSEGFGFGIFIWPILALLNVLGWRQKMFKQMSPLPIRVLVLSAKEHKWMDS